MCLTLYNRVKGRAVYGEKFESPSFHIGKLKIRWYKRLWEVMKQFFRRWR